jgi:hypothetical protein
MSGSSPADPSRRRFLRGAVLLGATSALGTVHAAALAPHAAAALPVRSFGPAIEELGPHQSATGCQSGNRPGVVAFKDFLHQHYANRGWGIGRACDASFGSSKSLHKEGRALDWTRLASNATQRQEADEVIAWLLATDS